MYERKEDKKENFVWETLSVIQSFLENIWTIPNAIISNEKVYSFWQCFYPEGQSIDTLTSGKSGILNMKIVGFGGHLPFFMFK